MLLAWFAVVDLFAAVVVVITINKVLRSRGGSSTCALAFAMADDVVQSFRRDCRLR